MLDVQMFGKLRVRSDGLRLEGLDARRVQELLVYLLLNRDRPHPREFLADLMWGDGSSAQVRKGLRQTLWKLQAVVGSRGEHGCKLLRVDPRYVQLNSDANLRLDVAELESAWKCTQGTCGADLDENSATALRSAVALYRGDLLDGWYQDWCLFERERLRNIFLNTLVKLMAHAEATTDYESGLEYGAMVLQMDPARERTHRIMMRLQCLSGHRVAAIRQYERCSQALQDEIGIAPSRRTVALYRQIRDDSPGLYPARAQSNGCDSHRAESVAAVLCELRQMRRSLVDMQDRVDHQIEVLEGSPTSR